MPVLADRAGDENGGVPAVRLMIVDDHQVFAEALAACLGAFPSIDVVGTATTTQRAWAVLTQSSPDLMIVDIDLGNESGLDLVARVREERPEVRSLVVSCHDDAETVCAAVRAGAAGFASKSIEASTLVEAVHTVGRGASWIAPEMLRDVLDLLLAGPPTASPEEQAVARLSERELEVLTLMVAGCDRATIAKQLFLSPNTVRTHAQNMLGKLGVHSSLEAVGLALRAGIRPAVPTGSPPLEVRHG